MKTLQRHVLHYWHTLDTTVMRWRIPASPRPSCCLNHTIQSMSKHETCMSAWLCAWTGREKLCVLFGCAQFSANAVAIIFWISRFSSLRLNPPRIGCLCQYKILPWLPHTHCHAQKCCSTCCVDSSWKPIRQQNSVSWLCPHKQKLFNLFCYRDGDWFCGGSRVVFTVVDQIAQTLHYSNARLRIQPNWASSGAFG